MIPAALFGEENAAAGWNKYFGEHSEPVADPAAYPSFNDGAREVRAVARAQPPTAGLAERSRSRQTDGGAAQRDASGNLRTYGSSFLVLALHQMITAATSLTPAAPPASLPDEEETAEIAKTAEKILLGDLSVLRGYFFS